MWTERNLTIYKTPKGEVFEGLLIFKRNGKNYVIDGSDIANLKAYPLADLEILGNSWDFIEKYHPDYYHEDEIAWHDDLECLIKNECDEEKELRLKKDWGNDPVEWEKAQENLYLNILEASIENYLNKK